MTPEYHQMALALLALLLFIIAGLLLTVLTDPYIDRARRNKMLIIIALVLGLIFQNCAEYIFIASQPERFVILGRTVTAIVGYSIRPMILVMFLYYVEPGKKTFLWVLCGVNTLIHMTALFSHICFWIDSDNYYHEGPLSETCLVVCLYLMVRLAWQSLRQWRLKQWKDSVILAFAQAIILISLVLDEHFQSNNQMVTFLTMAVVADCIFYYIWLHLQFVREREKDLVAGQRVRIMLSQIKPHFLYNSLSAITDLCDSDPRMAKQAIIGFSRYLRGNMESVAKEGTVLFVEELAHTRLYLDLEKMRFEDDLQICYNIQCTDFRIPSLTLQPLAENAVRHGVRGSSEGKGTVTLASMEFPDRYEVSVTDNGPGFDPSKPPDDGKVHIGLANVRERLSYVCKGELKIESVPGKGTVATIILPKDKVL